MTLYQRIYACKDEKTAKKAWYMAGVFEWPVMAFLGRSAWAVCPCGRRPGNV
jgi:solute:Na+ symporter, SSS family